MAYGSPADLRKAIPAETVVQIFDDNNDGEADEDSIEFFLEMAASLMNTSLEQLYTLPLQGTVPPILKYINVLLAVALSYDRHPEYVRATGEKFYDRAMALLKDIRAGRSGLDAAEGQLPAPANEQVVARSGSVDEPEPLPLTFNGPGAFGDF